MHLPIRANPQAVADSRGFGSYKMFHVKRDLGAGAPFEAVRGIEACCKTGRGDLGRCARKSPVWRRADGLCGMGFTGAAALRSGALQPPISFDVVGNGGEMDLALGLGKPDPSHGTKMIAAFPGPEDFFNSRPDRPQRDD